jgi:polyhydroxyalkanoate depolymerase
MLYQAYQVHSDIMVPVRSWATAALRAFGQPLAGVADNAVLRNLSAAYELIARTGLTHARPAFGIDSVTVGNREVAVHEHAALTTPFGTLLHFKKDIDTPQPRVLLVAPLSGHFSTLLRGTVRTMLPSTTSTSRLAQCARRTSDRRRSASTNISVTDQLS